MRRIRTEINSTKLYISLIKQRVYCNINNIIYCKTNQYFPEISSNLDIAIDKIYHETQIARYTSDKNIKNDLERIIYFLKNSCNIYVVLHEGEVAGRYALAEIDNFKPYRYLNHPIFNGCTHYIFFCRTYPQYQNNNVFKHVLVEMCRDTLRNNEHIYISCGFGNIASQRAIIGAGFQKIGELDYTSLLNL